jgi:ribonuclease BN (tRNA processing enzyme)
MKITFIGTSHGVPTAERYCSSAMIEAGDAVYFIDAGAPIMDELLRHGRSINDVRGVFITHCHSDHTNGLITMGTLLNWYYKEASVFFFTPEPEIIEAFAAWNNINHDGAIKEDRIKFRVYEDGPVYEDENISITAFPTAHLKKIEKPAHGFIVTDKQNGERIVFSGDLSQWLEFEDFPAIAMSEDVDALVCEYAHFRPEHINPYLEKCTAKALYFNHVSPLSKMEIIAGMNGSYPFPVRALCDNDVIEL